MLLIGLSLSFCVTDILLGNVKTKEILFMLGQADIELAVPQYLQTYWRDWDAEEVQRLLAELKPMYCRIPRGFAIPDGFWLDSNEPSFITVMGDDTDRLMFAGTYVRFVRARTKDGYERVDTDTTDRVLAGCPAAQIHPMTMGAVVRHRQERARSSRGAQERN